MEEGRIGQADSMFARAASMAEGDERAEALYLRAGVVRSGREAQAIYRQLLETAPNGEYAARAEIELAKIQFASGLYEGAYATLHESDACAESEEACLFEGMSAVMLHRYEDARPALERVRKGKNKTWAALSLAEAAGAAGQNDAACAEYEALARARVSPAAWYRHAECLERAGDKDGAKKEFAALSEAFPQTPEAVRAAEKNAMAAAPAPVPAPSPSQPAPVADRDAKPRGSGFTVQFGSFGDRANAIKLAAEIKRTYPAVRIDSELVNYREVFRVRCGFYASREDAVAAGDEMSKAIGRTTHHHAHSSEPMSDTSPLMSQYREIKKQYHDSILLFRVGDFYETFYEDAIDIASILNITLTSRDKNKAVPVPLAGVPFHAAEGYIGRLLAAGRKVAICEQTEDPALAKGLVRRDVVEVLTPGTALNAQLVADPDNNYCAAIHANGNGRVAVALIDVGTGECASGDAPADSFLHLLQGKRIRELVVSRAIEPSLRALLLEHLDNPFVTELEEEHFSGEGSADAFVRQFGDDAASASGSLADAERTVAAALLSHCMRLRGARLAQVVRIDRAGTTPFMHLDEETIGNLELFDPLRGGRNDATVLRMLDRTRTPMGNRELRHWMQKPLCDVTSIEERLDTVSRVYSDAALAETFVRELGGVTDIQRIVARVSARKAIPRELHALRESLEHIPALREAARASGTRLLQQASDELGDHAALCEMIANAIVPEPPSHLRDGGVIRRGYDKELDTLIDESEAAKQWIAGLEVRERVRTGIASLKVGYNKVFGYFIEISNAHKSAIPADYAAKQSLVNAQRFHTPELKEKEDLILHTEERRVREENRVFDALCASIRVARNRCSAPPARSAASTRCNRSRRSRAAMGTGVPSSTRA